MVATAEQVPRHDRPPRIQSDVARPLRSSFGGSLAVQIVNVATGLLLARQLGPHDRGVLAAVMLWPGLVSTLGTLGVADAVAYATARRREPVGAIVGSSLAIGLAQAFVLLAVAAAIVPIALGHLEASERPAAYAFLAFIPLNLLAIYLMSVLNGLQSFGWFQAIRTFGVLSTLVGLVVLTAIGRLSVLGAVAIYVAANVGMLAFAAARVLALTGGPLRVSGRTVRGLLSFGLRSHLGTVGSFLNARLDQLVISILLAPAKLGTYAVAATLTSLTGIVGASVASVGLPALARLENEERRHRAARDLVALTLLSSAVVTLPLLVFMPSLIRVLFGPEWMDAVAPARILLMGATVVATAQALGAVLRALGKPLNAAYAELAGVPAMAIGLAALVPAAGLVGAALASLAAYTASCLWMLRGASRTLGIRRTDLLPRSGDVRHLLSLLDLRHRSASLSERTS